MTSFRFTFIPDPSGLEVRLEGPSGPLAQAEWALRAPDTLLPGVDLLKRLEAGDSAVTGDDLVLIEHRVAASLSVAEAKKIGVPPLAEAIVKLQTKGLVTSPAFHVEVEWQKPNGQPIVGARRVGAFLRIGAEWRRIPEALFTVAEAAASLNAAEQADTASRLGALGALREALPEAAQGGLAQASGLVASMTIAVADAFSLDMVGDGDAAKLVPILHRASGEEAPLLPPAQQKQFGAEQFNGFGTVRPVYTLPGQWFVVLQPPLRKALSAVRQANSQSAGVRRALLRDPRAFLREVLGDETDETVLESLFRETAAYSERVAGLGLWIPRVVPWIKLEAANWFGSEEGVSHPPQTKVPDDGIMVGDRVLLIDEEVAQVLRDAVEEAIAAGRLTVPHEDGSGGTVAVPANGETLAALAALEAARRPPAPRSQNQESPEVLLIKTHETEVEVEADFSSARASLPPGPPAYLATPLKAHQREGLDWLQQAWAKGRPGVLLADDMGLGKTLQGLAFLTWLREGMAQGIVDPAPLLIVAPTGLLRNWRAEHDRHLAAPGLGHCTEAFGAGLARLKHRDGGTRPRLDVKALENSDWVLTTYETLRDFDRDFGQVRFAALLFDEAQKIKTPGVRITDAAKAMNAEFRVALTGTPVENRLADLWCITDTVQPGLLGDLRSFSATYERDPNPEALRGLKTLIEGKFGGRPQLMLRRMKEDRLPDLPLPDEKVSARAMPPVQRSAYDEALAEARGARVPGAVLKALQSLRAISLHPGANDGMPDKEFIAASARLTAAFEVMDAVAAAGEKALIFVGDLDMQARLAGILQRRYRLPFPPAIINGSVDGSVRQARVDAFQASPNGFGAMVLSPQAGGVGLTLTRANHAIHLSRWWNPAVEDQCTGRVLRIGQTRPVFVHIPMAVFDNSDSGKAFDENLDVLLKRKRQLMRDTLMPSDATVNGDRDELFRATVFEGGGA